MRCRLGIIRRLLERFEIVELGHLPLVPGDRSALGSDVVLALISHILVAIFLSGIASGELVLRFVPLGEVTALALLEGPFFEERNVVLPVWHLLAKH